MNHKGIAALILAPLFALSSSGCIVTMAVPPVAAVYGPPVEYGYEPLLYNGYVVYYTGGGVPFYWVGGARVWVPAYARHRYVTHWKSYKPAYDNWYRHRGYAYRSRRFNSDDVRAGEWHGGGKTYREQRPTYRDNRHANKDRYRGNPNRGTSYQSAPGQERHNRVNHGRTSSTGNRAGQHPSSRAAPTQTRHAKHPRGGD